MFMILLLNFLAHLLSMFLRKSMSPNPTSSGDPHRHPLDMNSTMQLLSGHRGNLPRTPAFPPLRSLRSMASMICTWKNGILPGLHSSSLSETSTRTVIRHPVQPIGNPSTPDLSTRTNATVACLDGSSMTTGLRGNSSVRESTDSVVDTPMEHPTIQVPMKPVGLAGQAGKAVPFECCSCGEGDCLIPSPPPTAPPTPIEAAGQNGMPVAYQSCGGGKDDHTLPNGPMATSSNVPERLKRLREKFNAMACCPCGDKDCIFSMSPIPSPTLDGYFGQKKDKPVKRRPCRLVKGMKQNSPTKIPPSLDGNAGQEEKPVALEDGQLEEGEFMLPGPAMTTPSVFYGYSGQQKISGPFERCPCGQPNCIIPNPPITTPPSPLDGYSRQNEQSVAFENSQWDVGSFGPPSPSLTLPSTSVSSEATPAMGQEVKSRGKSGSAGWENYIFRHKTLEYDNLKSCPDFRAQHDNEHAVGGWAIGEGSLVVGINPCYVVPAGGAQPLDQLELKEGKLYMVEHIYGDLWALCVEFSTSKLHNGLTPGAPNQVVRLGFVPLCAVTLAANYSSFLERCQEYQEHPDIQRLNPTNGARVPPPERIQSLAVSREMHHRVFAGRSNWGSKNAQRLCSKFRPIGEGDQFYEPKDRMSRMKLLAKQPSQAWKKLTTKKLVVKASWIGPDPVAPQPPTRPRKKLTKGTRRRIDFGEGLRRFCTLIRGT